MTGTTLGILIAVLTTVTAVVAIGPVPLRRLLARWIPSVDPDYFSCRILKLEEDTGSGYSDVLAIQIQGVIRAPRERCDTDLLICLTDVSEGNSGPKPVLCRRPEWSAEGSSANETKIHNGTLPARVSALTDWVTAIEIRTSDLVFPRRGPCLLECVLSVVETETGKPLASARGQVQVDCESRGYEEIRQQRSTKQAAILQLASCVWEWTRSNPEAKTILDQWLSQQSFGAGQSAETLLDSFSGSPEERVDQACDDLLGWAEPADRYIAVELCLTIAAACSDIPKDLLGRLLALAEKLEIPKERFQALSQKYLTGRVGHMEDPRALLGLTEEMTEPEIHQKLTAEYRKWNARVTHPDAAVRAQADQMLNLIAQFRSRCGRHS